MMRRHYKILQDNCPDRLQEEVNKYLECGFELAGGLTVARATGRPLYAQAVICTFPETPEEG